MGTTTKTILITSEQPGFLDLENWCVDQNLQLIAQSFIQIEAIEKLAIPKTDWIFFSSPKGAKAYLDHHPVRAKKIGVVGEATGSILLKANLSVDFTGAANDDPEIIGQKFNTILGENATVLFPISQISKKTVSSAIHEKQLTHLITYHTVAQPVKVAQDPDIILFTSPSNFDSYLEYNEVKESTLIIAMGKTTETAIKAVLIEREILILTTPTPTSLKQLLSAKL